MTLSFSGQDLIRSNDNHSCWILIYAYYIKHQRLTIETRLLTRIISSSLFTKGKCTVAAFDARWDSIPPSRMRGRKQNTPKRIQHPSKIPIACLQRCIKSQSYPQSVINNIIINSSFTLSIAWSGVSLEPSGYYVIDKDMAHAYNTKNLCLLIGQILIDNAGRYLTVQGIDCGQIVILDFRKGLIHNPIEA